MKRFSLDLRAVFRRFGKREQAEWAAAIRSARPKKNADGEPTGGSLAAEVKRSPLLKVKRWGYVLRLHALGQKLTWLVRGTKRQAARPIEVDTDEDALAEALETEAQAQFSAWDRKTNA